MLFVLCNENFFRNENFRRFSVLRNVASDKGVTPDQLVSDFIHSSSNFKVQKPDLDSADEWLHTMGLYCVIMRIYVYT